MDTPPNSSPKTGNMTTVGFLLGMGCGTALALLLDISPTLGLGFGMFIGAAIGTCADKDQPKRSRLALAVFTTVVAIAVLLRATM